MPKVLSAPPQGASRGARTRRVSTTLAEINVIPLVDVMLVLLIIFMVAAPMLQRGVEVDLPVAKQARDIVGERLFVDVPYSFAKDRRVFVEKETIRLEILAERVRQTLAGRTDRQVFLRSDHRLDVQTLLDVMDALKSGGVEQIGIVTNPPSTR